MTDLEREEGVEWEPDFTPEQRERFEALNARAAAQVSIIKKLRGVLGMSQDEVAQLLGTTQSAISKIEIKGDAPISVLARMVQSKGARLRMTVETTDGDQLSFAVA